MMKRFLVIAWACVLFSGCSDPLKGLVNIKWPPVTAEQQRQDALSTTAQTLTRLTTPGIAMGVQLSDVRGVLLTRKLKELGVQEIVLEGDRQLLSLRVKFSRQFTDADAGDNAELRPLLATLRPEIAGSIAIYAGVTSVLATERPVPELEFRVLPALAQVTVDKIKLADKVDVKLVAEPLVTLLNRYKDNISGELSRASFMKVKIPALAPTPFDLSQSFQVTQSGGSAQVVVSASPIKVPFKLDGVAWLITEKNLTALVQLGAVDVAASLVAGKAPAQAAGASSAANAVAAAGSAPVPSEAALGAQGSPATFDAVKARVEELLRVGFEVPDASSSTWVAIRKDIVAIAMNSAVSQAGLCFTATASTPNERVSTKIPMPKTDEIHCAQDEPCNLATCTFQWEEDTRGCSGWGKIPCEIGKAAENQRRLAAENTRVAACQGVASIDRGICEARKTTRRGTCEAGKAGLKLLGPNIANVDTEVALRTDGAKVCLQDFTLTPALDRVQFALNVQGEAVASVMVEFTPLDVVGHSFCFKPWQKRETFRASLTDSRIGVSSAIQLSTEEVPARVVFKTDPLPVKARLSPSPIEYLLNNRDMAISCPIVAAARPIVFNFVPLIKELRGEIDYTLPPQKASLDLALPTQKVGDVEVEARVVATASALIITGRLLPSK